MPDPDAATIAGLAFDVYRDVMGTRGGPGFAARMPTWESLSLEMRQVWTDAAQPLIDREAEARDADRQRVRELVASQIRAAEIGAEGSTHPELSAAMLKGMRLVADVLDRAAVLLGDTDA